MVSPHFLCPVDTMDGMEMRDTHGRRREAVLHIGGVLNASPGTRQPGTRASRVRLPSNDDTPAWIAIVCPGIRPDGHAGCVHYRRNPGSNAEAASMAARHPTTKPPRPFPWSAPAPKLTQQGATMPRFQVPT